MQMSNPLDLVVQGKPIDMMHCKEFENRVLFREGQDSVIPNEALKFKTNGLINLFFSLLS
jgi:hypothetical protein